MQKIQAVQKLVTEQTGAAGAPVRQTHPVRKRRGETQAGNPAETNLGREKEHPYGSRQRESVPRNLEPGRKVGKEKAEKLEKIQQSAERVSKPGEKSSRIQKSSRQKIQRV